VKLKDGLEPSGHITACDLEKCLFPRCIEVKVRTLPQRIGVLVSAEDEERSVTQEIAGRLCAPRAIRDS
jgi:hypothetical protein